MIKSNKKVIIKFSATWCYACNQLKPKYLEMAKKYKDIIFVTVDVDEGEAIADKYRVELMPDFAGYDCGRKIKVGDTKDMDRVDILKILLRKIN